MCCWAINTKRQVNLIMQWRPGGLDWPNFQVIQHFREELPPATSIYDEAFKHFADDGFLSRPRPGSGADNATIRGLSKSAKPQSAKAFATAPNPVLKVG